MHALIQNGVVRRYPYGLIDLQRDNPNVSFARDDDATLEEYGVFRVFNATQPEFDARKKTIEEGTPEFDPAAQRWTQVWVVKDLPAEEVQRIEDDKARNVRAERNAKLSACDWTQLSDAPLSADQKQAWGAYRQALRDVTGQSGFPWAVTWPDAP